MLNLEQVRKIFKEPYTPPTATHGLGKSRRMNNKVVSDKERKEIYDYWLTTKQNRGKVALRFGRSKSTVDRIVSSFNLGDKVI